MTVCFIPNKVDDNENNGLERTGTDNIHLEVNKETNVAEEVDNWEEDVDSNHTNDKTRSISCISFVAFSMCAGISHYVFTVVPIWFHGKYCPLYGTYFGFFQIFQQYRKFLNPLNERNQPILYANYHWVMPITIRESAIYSHYPSPESENVDEMGHCDVGQLLYKTWPEVTGRPRPDIKKFQDGNEKFAEMQESWPG